MTTITHEQFEAALIAYDKSSGPFPNMMHDAFVAAGITIAPPQPSPEMVSLAEELAYETGNNMMPRDYALAALQHFERVVRDAPQMRLPPNAYADDLCSRAAILTAIGSMK